MAEPKPERVADMKNSLTRFPTFLLILIVLATAVSSGTSLAASTSLNASPGFAGAGLPSEFGEIVYQKHPECPVQLYIIGNSHRSSSTGHNGINTVPSQVQTYRIGEWLIRQYQVELLLPEGFFGRKGSAGILDAAVWIEEPALEETLADTSTFINADLLLHRNYGVGLQQVEDREMYRNVREYLHTGLQNGGNLLASFGLELEYLQERRSAAILQSIPAAIDSEYRQGNIAQPRAILTIGMAHLDEIIKFLELGKIEIPAPPIGASGFEAYSEALELLAKGVGVTVIVPRAILDDREMMHMAKLEPELEVPR
jgi:hypothetical protein